MSGIAENGARIEASIGHFQRRIWASPPTWPSKFGQKGKKAAELADEHPGRVEPVRLARIHSSHAIPREYNSIQFKSIQEGAI